MKLNPTHVADFRKSLAVVEPSAFGLLDVEVFPGTTPYSTRSTIVCKFDTEAKARLSAAGEEAARLIEARLGIQIAWGVHADAGEPLALWIEYFPGGARYGNASFALQALQAAFTAVAAASSGDALHAEAAERETARLAKTPVQDIFVQSQFLITAARNADIPVDNLGGSGVAWRFGWGSRSEICFMTASLADSVPGHQITWRKHIAKPMFREIGIPTPKWRVIAADGDALRAAKEVGWPCVVKPVDRAFGAGVTANIAGPAELPAAVALARRLSGKIIVEAHEPGDDHRLMVLDGRLIAAIRREPPKVTGDGKRTIEQLIAALNGARDGTRATGFLLPVKRDAELDATLASRGLSMDSVLPNGTTLVLRSIANFSTGGSAIDVTDRVHPQIRGLAELLAVSLSLRTAGIDYLTTDISRSHAEVGGGFIEVNAMPRLRLLMSDPRSTLDIGALVLGDRPGRIPVTLIIADEDALADLADPVRQRIAASPGSAAASLQWAQIGPTELPLGAVDPFSAVSAVLRHLAVDELVILWTPDEIRRFGLPVDRIAKAVVIGQDTGGSWLAKFCPDIVLVADASAAIEAAFAPPADTRATDSKGPLAG